MIFFHLNRQFTKHLKPKQLSPDMQHQWCVLKFKILFQFQTFHFSFWSPSHNNVVASCKKEQTTSCKTVFLFEHPIYCLEGEAGWMEHEICETDMWLAADRGQYFSWCINCPLTLWSTFCEFGKNILMYQTVSRGSKQCTENTERGC